MYYSNQLFVGGAKFFSGRALPPRVAALCSVTQLYHAVKALCDAIPIVVHSFFFSRFNSPCLLSVTYSAEILNVDGDPRLQ